MGCGCGKAKPGSLQGKIQRAEMDLRLNEHGLYDLKAAPDGCSKGYSGPFTSATVYVADRGGPHEKFFTRKQYDEASIYARTHDVPIVHVMASNLCDDVMQEFLHGAST